MAAISDLFAFKKPGKDSFFSSSGEGSSFLALYSKRNSLHTNIPLANEKKIVGPNGEKQGAVIQQYSLNFKDSLLPVLLTSGRHAATDYGEPVETLGRPPDVSGNRIPEDGRHELGIPPLITSVPTESHWHALNQMRIHAGAPERSEKGAERLVAYYAQLTCLEAKFPFETDQLQLGFTWFESCFPKQKVVTNCIQYEKGCVLFNLGAVYSQLGNIQTLWTAEGVKKAAAYFQKAAGTLMFVRDALLPRFQIKLDKSSDMSDYTLTAAATLMLAQAQECFYEKANHDKASSQITSQIAATTSDYYEEAFRAAKSNNSFARIRFPRSWPLQMKARRLMFLAVAHYHAPATSGAEHMLAERITRLSVARELIQKGERHARSVGGATYEMMKFYLTTVEVNLGQAEEINFDEYHQTIPNSRLLPPLKRLPYPLVGPSSFPGTEGHTDIFSDVVGPNSFDDVQGYMGEIRSTLEFGEENLRSIEQEIDCKLAALHIYTSESNTQQSPKQNDEKFSSTLVEQIKAHQRDEETLGSAEMLTYLNRLHEIIAKGISESFQILDNVDVVAFPSNPAIFKMVGELRSAATYAHEKLRACKPKLRELHELYELEVADFCPLQWNEEQLIALIPGLDPAFVEEREKPTDVAWIHAERDEALARVDAIKKDCCVLLRQVESFCASQKSNSLSLEDREKGRQRLRDFDEAITKNRNEKNDLLVKLEELSNMMEKAERQKQEQLESDKIEKAFRDSLSHYQRFRDGCQDEIELCTRLREETLETSMRCHKLPYRKPQENDTLSTHAPNGDVTAVSTPAIDHAPKLELSPTRDHRDPMISHTADEPAASGSKQSTLEFEGVTEEPQDPGEPSHTGDAIGTQINATPADNLLKIWQHQKEKVQAKMSVTAAKQTFGSPAEVLPQNNRSERIRSALLNAAVIDVGLEARTSASKWEVPPTDAASNSEAQGSGNLFAPRKMDGSYGEETAHDLLMRKIDQIKGYGSSAQATIDTVSSLPKSPTVDTNSTKQQPTVATNNAMSPPRKRSALAIQNELRSKLLLAAQKKLTNAKQFESALAHRNSVSDNASARLRNGIDRRSGEEPAKQTIEARLDMINRTTDAYVRRTAPCPPRSLNLSEKLLPTLTTFDAAKCSIKRSFLKLVPKRRDSKTDDNVSKIGSKTGVTASVGSREIATSSRKIPRKQIFRMPTAPEFEVASDADECTENESEDKLNKMYAELLKENQRLRTKIAKYRAKPASKKSVDVQVEMDRLDSQEQHMRRLERRRNRHRERKRVEAANCNEDQSGNACVLLDMPSPRVDPRKKNEVFRKKGHGNKTDDTARWAIEQSAQLLRKRKPVRSASTKQRVSSMNVSSSLDRHLPPLFGDLPASVMAAKRLSKKQDYSDQIAASCDTSIVGTGACAFAGNSATAHLPAKKESYHVDTGLRDVLSRMRTENEKMVERFAGPVGSRNVSASSSTFGHYTQFVNGTLQKT